MNLAYKILFDDYITNSSVARKQNLRVPISIHYWFLENRIHGLDMALEYILWIIIIILYSIETICFYLNSRLIKNILMSHTKA